MSVREIKTTCCYCGVGCGVIVTTDGASITAVRGDPDHPANRGALCSKGAALAETASPALADLRLAQPELRRERDAPRESVSWDAALDHVADRFASIIAAHGPDAVAFYVSGQLLTEDYYVFNKLAKGLIGTNNIDTNSRLCMSSAVAGYKQTLGADAPPCSYEDLDRAETVFIAGSNTAWAHPILFRRLEAARARNPAMKVIVVDPRRTDTARAADLHLAILPGTDVALFHGMLHVMLWERRLDEAYIAAHTSGFDALRDGARSYPPGQVARVCGIAEADIVTAARWFAASGATLSLYCQGLNQSTAGTDKNAALVNLHLATGQIGKPGAGPFSLTGQPNAMGGREVGGLANLLSAHRDLRDPAHRAEVAALWGVPWVPAAPGKTAVELFDALAEGTVKAVWIACTNPAQSLPDQSRVRDALAKAELVVVQEAYRDAETVAYADVLLPAATWAEKDGTVTNSERRITRVRPAVSPHGEARADWAIAVDFARRLERRLPSRSSAPLFPYDTPESVWNEHRESTRGRDLDITGLDYAILESRGPQQWPMPAGAREGTARLYTDGRFATPDGRARFAAVEYRPLAEAVDARHPLRLLTGRLRDQWHSGTRTATLPRAFGHAPEPVIELAPADAARRGIAAGDLVEVASRRGRIIVTAATTDDLRSGQAFLAMHWGERFLAGRDAHGVNALTPAAFDPVSKQPELKGAAVRVVKVALPWRLVAFAYPQAGTSAPALAAQVHALVRDAAYASVVLLGDARAGVLVRAADAEPLPDTTLAAIDTLLGLDRAGVLRYADARRGVARAVAIDDARGTLHAVRLAGPLDALQAEGWLREWLVSGHDVSALRRSLLAPSAAAPAGFAPRGRTICNCFGVSERAVASALDAAAGDADMRLAKLQTELRCGTQCGSCLVELKTMARRAAHSQTEHA